MIPRVACLACATVSYWITWHLLSQRIKLLVVSTWTCACGHGFHWVGCGDCSKPACESVPGHIGCVLQL
jgi:hypothetical protein